MISPSPPLPTVERRERPTMKDVAALAGVSIKTVSRVVSDVPTVAPELVARVRDAADKLGYRPNLTAANLRRADRRTNTIGLLLEDVSNPYSSAVHRAVEDYFRSRDVLVLAGSLDGDPARERSMTRTLIDRRVDGLIVMPAAQDHRYVVAEQQAGTSFVFIDRPPTPLLADAVVTDNRAGGRHRRPAPAADRPPADRLPRRRRCHCPPPPNGSPGTGRPCAAAGIEIDDRLVRHGLRTAAQARAAADELLDTHAARGGVRQPEPRHHRRPRGAPRPRPPGPGRARRLRRRATRAH